MDIDDYLKLVAERVMDAQEQGDKLEAIRLIGVCMDALRDLKNKLEEK